MITKKAAEKKGFIPMKVEVEVWIDPKTNNIYYPCQECGDRLYDKFIYLTDPAVVEGEVVNVLCKDHKKKHQRKQFAVKIGDLIAAGVYILIDDKWQKFTKRLLKKIHDQFPDWFKEIIE